MTNQTILAASGDARTRELVRMAAQAEQVDVILCGDGKEAFESIQKEASKIKLVILESFLPKMDGFEIAKKLEDISQTKDIPILMLVGHGKDSLQSCSSGAISQNLATRVRLNADNYIQKPFDLKEIQSSIHSMLKYYRPHGAPHPMTRLGGHVQIENEVFARLAKGEVSVYLWVDINFFKPYNDHYGSSKGDEVLKSLHAILLETIQSLPEENEPFLAHVDGDDFILLLKEEDEESVCSLVRQKFEQLLPKFFSDEERAQGFFYEKAREDQKRRVFPLMRISAVGVRVRLEKFQHYGCLVASAQDVLRQAKSGEELPQANR